MNQPFTISALSPQIVWRHFETLCHIPRPSKHEQQLRTHLEEWAKARGLDTYIDQVGNLIIRKPAKQGFEHLKGVILQGHLDMVTQANQGTVHDFFKDPITPIVDGEWLVAPHTTLGADNGIGVALALAVLESDDIDHGPLEVLLTIDEEAGMSGARLLEPNLLKGEWLFNIDTEEWGELYLGCAGSIDLEAKATFEPASPSAHAVYFDLNVRGLRGGHSGVDIHLGRGNANVILSQLLANLNEQLDLSLVQFHGGSARNAIAREGFATIGVPEQQVPLFKDLVQAELEQWKTKLHSIDDNLQIECVPSTLNVTQIVANTNKEAWLKALAHVPYGVHQMSAVLDGVVETSNNLGVIRLEPDHGEAILMIRSMVNDEILHIAERISDHFNAYDIPTYRSEMISGWTPNPDSSALKCLQKAYQASFQLDPHLKVIHAGLECGIIAEHYPHLQMVSFGPDIRGAHAPGERVHIVSVEKCWQLLKTALQLVEPK